MEIMNPFGPFNLCDYVKKLIKLIIRDRVPARASSLAYTTILALVPLMTVLISFGSVDLVEGPIKDLITTTMIPTSQDFIFDLLTSFAENSRKLGTWGLTITIVVVFLLINKIEIDVNTILRARPNKNFITRIAIYITTLIFSTITIGSSFSITNDFIELLTLKLPEKFSPLETIFSSLGSLLLIALTILLLMMLVSSARVNLKSAVIGALLGALTWELAKKGFSLWANYSIRNSVIYGSFFMIPLLFIWINLAWMIILISLEITYLHQHPNYLLYMEENHQSPAIQAILTMEVYLYILGEFRGRRKPPQLEDITLKTGLPEQEVLVLIDRLLKYVLIIRTSQKGYQPATDGVSFDERELLSAALDEEAIDENLLTGEARKIWKNFITIEKNNLPLQ